MRWSVLGCLISQLSKLWFQIFPDRETFKGEGIISSARSRSALPWSSCWSKLRTSIKPRSIKYWKKIASFIKALKGSGVLSAITFLTYLYVWNKLGAKCIILGAKSPGNRWWQYGYPTMCNKLRTTERVTDRDLCRDEACFLNDLKRKGWTCCQCSEGGNRMDGFIGPSSGGMSCPHVVCTRCRHSLKVPSSINHNLRAERGPKLTHSFGRKLHTRRR